MQTQVVFFKKADSKLHAKSLMTLMTLTLMTAFHVSSATFNAYFPVLQCFCNKVLIENDRKYYLSATYAIFSIES